MEQLCSLPVPNQYDPAQYRILQRFYEYVVKITETEVTIEMALSRFAQNEPTSNIAVWGILLNLVKSDKELFTLLVNLFNSISNEEYKVDEKDPTVFAIVKDNEDKLPTIMRESTNRMVDILASALQKGMKMINKTMDISGEVVERKQRLLDWMEREDKAFVLKFFRYLMYFFEMYGFYESKK